jgi:hypothetical protein
MRVRVNELLHDEACKQRATRAVPAGSPVAGSKALLFHFVPGFALPQNGKLPPGGRPPPMTRPHGLHTVLE